MNRDTGILTAASPLGSPLGERPRIEAFATLAGGPESQIIDSLECAWRGMITRPESEILDEPDWFQVTTPTIREEFLNGVYITDLEDDAQAITRIRETVAKYRELGVPFRWVVGPRTRPLAIRDELSALGLSLDYSMRGLAADPQSIAIEISAQIEVIFARSRDECLEWSRTNVRGWSENESLVEGLATDVERLVTEKSDEYVYVLARVGGQPAGAGSLRVMQGPWGAFGHFIGSSVLPEFRNRGVYRALTEHRLRWMRARSIPLATIHAVDSTSAPIGEKLGFQRFTYIEMWHST